MDSPELLGGKLRKALILRADAVTIVVRRIAPAIVGSSIRVAVGDGAVGPPNVAQQTVYGLISRSRNGGGRVTGTIVIGYIRGWGVLGVVAQVGAS